MKVAGGSNPAQSILKVRLRIVGVERGQEGISDPRLISPSDLAWLPFRNIAHAPWYAVFVKLIGEESLCELP
jgi:hypothetical protein